MLRAIHHAHVIFEHDLSRNPNRNRSAAFLNIAIGYVHELHGTMFK